MYYNCNKTWQICNHLIISDSVSVVTVDGTDTLVIDLPSTTNSAYLNGHKYCVVVAQTVPTTATITMPVAFSIGGDTTTVYPFVKCDCSQVTACAIQTRTKYPVLVSTNATSGVFKSLRRLNCYPTNVLASLPVTTTAEGAIAPISAETFTLAQTAKKSNSTAKTTTLANSESK